MIYLCRKACLWALLSLLAGSVQPLQAQADVINNVRDALKSGSSRELSKYLNNTIEISINGEQTSYSRNQAEFVLKDFFAKYPPKDFRYVHQGSSKEGVKYTIGTLIHERGEFRVVMLIKQFGGSYLVDKIDFNRE
ncbi:DUF4783 domain-containing protein [Tunicatimonas pelagia]|uniref:DUF4783 domain-containing protein n=1 Tax=Tunicatimonas pelagia TaxID=931531 RepID=UPI0026671468|nr:DUF4783 domain-containing protein [Tunicatimonas pelagia]WKN41988.1 DUF4783 domain-containing protein [Tunicatimonas pelagia]